MIVDSQLVKAEITYPAEPARGLREETCSLYFGGMPLVKIPCDLFHAVQNYSPFVFNCELQTLAETAAFLATQPESEGI